jgi:glycosyltransferase involved in cell wall biosynthesis
MKLSIITINRNNASGLEKTIQTVVTQTFTDFEYIVIDGASDDGSVDVIKKYADKITGWVSEPDAGIYNAMNKGIRRAQGEFCLFLNSGDWLIEDKTLENVFAEIGEKEQADIYYSDHTGSDNKIAKLPEKITPKFLLMDSISHPNSIIRTKLFFGHEFYNENLKIVADWEFFFRELLLHKSKFIKINSNIAIFLNGGISQINSSLADNERIQVIKDVFSGLDDIIDILLDGINWQKNCMEMIVQNIKNRKGLGVKTMILDCIPAFLQRKKKHSETRKIK